eukprot:jgi/Sobl393_1/14627/SZX78339.1
MWGLSLCKEAGFRQVYIKQLFERRFNELVALIKGHARHHSLVPEFLQQRGSSRGFPASITIKLLSIGCGPGVDAVALIACLRSLSRARISFDVTLVDAAAGWKDKAVAAVKAAGAGGSVDFLTGSFADECVNDVA